MSLRSSAAPLLAALLTAILALLAACSSEPAVTKGGGQTIGEAQSENANGTKYRIAVAPIVDKSGAQPEQSVARQLAVLNAAADKGHQMTAGSVTSGIRDMLVTELFNSGQFIVLDREDLSQVMVEQDFAQSARVGDSTRIPLGQLEGADLLVVGALTAFDAGTGSDGGAIPIPIPLGRDAQFGWSVVNIGFKRGYAAMDLRVIDVATGRVLASTAVEGKNTRWGVNVTGLFNVGGGTIALPGVLSYFNNTPVEEALQKMVAAAIATITAQKPSRAVVSPAAPLQVPTAAPPAKPAADAGAAPVAH